MNLKIKALEVNENIMSDLESKGILRRLMPGRDILPVGPGQSKHESVYESHPRFGPHKLIGVTINSTEPKNFLYHNDNEDFLLIDLLDREDLVITIGLIDQKEMNEKIKRETLTPKDFISLIFKPNDPYLSFFTMKAGYAHVETCRRVSDKPPSFYVTESRDLDENYIDLGKYKLEIEV